MEELNDACEILMEHSACTRVRDQTVETQANYTKLLTSAQGKIFPTYFLLFPVGVATISNLMISLFNHRCLLHFSGLVAKVEKNLSDHTEFLNYKNEMDKWLAKANETLESCFGIGNENETKQKMEAVTVSVANCDHTLFQPMT